MESLFILNWNLDMLVLRRGTKRCESTKQTKELSKKHDEAGLTRRGGRRLGGLEKDLS